MNIKLAVHATINGKPYEGETTLYEVTGSDVEDVTIATLKNHFPADLASLLRFVKNSDEPFIKIIPRKFLGSTDFSQVAAIIRELNGEYISAGRDSHFRV